MLGSHQINSNVAISKRRDSLNYTHSINSIDCAQEPPSIRLQGGLGLEKLKTVMFADNSMIKVESNGADTIENPIYDSRNKKITEKKLRFHSLFRPGDISPASKRRSENLGFVPHGETILELSERNCPTTPISPVKERLGSFGSSIFRRDFERSLTTREPRTSPPDLTFDIPVPTTRPPIPTHQTIYLKSEIWALNHNT
jgi:hypothetical protein